MVNKYFLCDIYIYSMPKKPATKKGARKKPVRKTALKRLGIKSIRQNPWLEHVDETIKKNPTVSSYKDILKKASKSYKKITPAGKIKNIIDLSSFNSAPPIPPRPKKRRLTAPPIPPRPKKRKHRAPPIPPRPKKRKPRAPPIPPRPKKTPPKKRKRKRKLVI